ncbi:CLUMA_CG017253, isoform A [Clunio marinus]|uniref:CLUMA_CG017253, isoform A n=1 Tax=Clunio marinus TaxID=568069 RepID=A0A1J1IYC2_9DIPT|nr:CLUMA_CG017253, isoform A [Clunio marinus]
MSFHPPTLSMLQHLLTYVVVYARQETMKENSTTYHSTAEGCISRNLVNWINYTAIKMSPQHETLFDSFSLLSRKFSLPTFKIIKDVERKEKSRLKFGKNC